MDQQKALVPGAKVEVKNIATGVVTVVQTNASGLYSTPPLNPGMYTVTVSAPGFKTAVQEQVELRVADRKQVDVVLEVGALTETVTVTGEVPLLDTSQASMGTVLDRRAVENLPTFSRNPYTLVRFTAAAYYAPGRSSSGERPFDNGGMDNLTVNGGRSGFNEYLLDGTPNSNNSDSANRNFISYVPPSDAVAEFRLQTNLYDAEYGRTSGGVVNVALKSGTNTVHGSAYWYLRNDKLNANDLRSRARGIPLSAYRWNQPGFQVEGPVILPKLYDGRNRTFFMVAWEAIRSSVPRPTSMHLPTDAEWSGDFSKTYVSGTSGPAVAIYDPLTTVQVGNNFTRSAFPGSIIPPSRINSMALGLRKYYPKPNIGPVSRSEPNLQVSPNPTTDAYDTFTLRVDQELTSKHRFSGTFVRSHRTEDGGLGGGRTAFIAINARAAAATYEHSRYNLGSNFSVTSTLTPTMVSTFRAGFNYHYFDITPYGHGFDPTQLGFPSSLVAQAKNRAFPVISITGFQTIGNSSFTGAVRGGNTWSITESLSKLISSHSVKLGFEGRLILNNRATRPPFATLSFTRGFTQANVTASGSAGDGFATFLLGYPSSVSSLYDSDFAYGNRYYGLFLQDDWRVSRQLTINLGLRWDYEAPITERWNRMVVDFNPTGTATLGSIPVKGGLVFASASDRLAFKKDFNNFQPRIGVAYQPLQKLVFRGGWGISYQPGSADFPPATGFSITTSPQTSVGGIGFVPITAPGCTGGNCGMLSNPFPDGILQPPGSSLGLLTNAGSSLSFYERARPLPYLYSFSAGFQYELPFRSVIELSYAGSRQRLLPTSRNLNSITYAEYLKYGQATGPDPACGSASTCTLNTAIPNPFAGLVPGTGLNGSTYSLEQSLRPYPQFTSITVTENLGTSRYDALQLRFEKRLSHGLTAQVTGHWEHNTSYSTYQNSGMDARGQFIQRYSGNPRKVINLMFSYEVPLFTPGTLSYKLLGGWTISGTGSWQEGGMISIGGAIPTGVDPRIDNPTPARMFNTCTFNQTNNSRQNCASTTEPIAWIIQKPFTLNLYPTKQWYDWRTPVPFTMNLAVFKAFRLREQTRLELRGEAFNAFNTPNKSWANTTATSADFGKIISGSISQSNDPRNIQASMRISF